MKQWLKTLIDQKKIILVVGLLKIMEGQMTKILTQERGL